MRIYRQDPYCPLETDLEAPDPATHPGTLLYLAGSSYITRPIKSLYRALIAYRSKRPLVRYPRKLNWYLESLHE